MGSHVHAESMKLYAEDAAETDRPWERWELRPTGTKATDDRGWFTCTRSPRWSTSMQYRRKPRTININGFQVPEPMRAEPGARMNYYAVSLSRSDTLVTQRYWVFDESQRSELHRGLCHHTREAAESHARALLSFTSTEETA